MSKNESEKIRYFSLLMQNLEGGNLEADLSRDLQQGIEKLNAHYENYRGNPSMEINIKIKITKDGINMDTKADYTVKTPKQPRTRTALFLTPDNFLSKRNPNQREFTFRDVTGENQQTAFRPTN